MSRIPIKNIYHMLCYAWDILDEADQVDVNFDEYTQDINLLGKLLNSGFNFQLKRGLFRDYINREEEISLIKGKLHFASSIKNNSFLKCKAVCSYDEYSENIYCNQVIKTALVAILKHEGLSSSLALEVKSSIQSLSHVDIILDITSIPSQFKVPRNFKFYKFLLSVSSFILKNSSPSEKSGLLQFSDFARNPHKLRTLYEKFILNFYKREISCRFAVSNHKYMYAGVDYNSSDSKFVPRLATDIELVSLKTGHKIIIDTKFEQDTLGTHHYGTQEKIHSKYLMQLMTYLENTRRSSGVIASGMLLYPTIEKHYEFSNSIWEYDVTVCNINLNDEWDIIERNLIEIINSHMIYVEGDDILGEVKAA